MIQEIILKNKMPTFFMFSTLDKNMLKHMLFRATDINDDQIEDLKHTLFGNLIGHASQFDKSSVPGAITPYDLSPAKEIQPNHHDITLDDMDGIECDHVHGIGH